MGGDKKKRRHEETLSDSSTGSSDDELEQHKKRKRKDKDKDKGKKPKKEKDKKSKKNSKKDDNEKRLLKEAKKFLKQRLKSGGQEDGPPPDNTPLEPSASIATINEDDYFAKNPEFSTWLRDERGQFFNELSADETHALFKDYVKAWNSRKLPARHYAGIVGSAMRRTTHQWGLRGGTEHASKGAIGMAAAIEEEREMHASQRAAQWQERKQWRLQQKEELDELLPKATGREALLEKKAARREAAKAREDSPDLVKLPGGGDVMGGDDSFAAAKARQERQTDWRSKQQAVRQEGLNHRVAAAQAADDEKMAQFRALLSAGPIQIPKR
ncbi:hypothetical protein WJX72_009298 [[Myrmecia] bisecta]|uniref:Uncharacterized protein n=1 Tax=[Myrmecia] bisecta TaxID=41462 RepID=A0AAW1R8S3_9CHLO